MDSPQEQSDRPWLHRFSTAELAGLVFIFSVMGALVWYKKFYEPRIAVIPSSSSANQRTPSAAPEPTMTPQSEAAATPLPAEDSNPFSNVYINPFE